MVRAVAESRGWPHAGHRDLAVAISNIARDSRNRRLHSLFGSAMGLQTNYFEGWLPASWVEQSLDEAAELIRELEAFEA